MTKYTILSAKNDEDLSEAVQTHLNEGWKLHGGPFAVVIDEHYWVQQSLIFPLIPSDTSNDLQVIEYVINLCDKYKEQLAYTYSKDIHRTLQHHLTDLQSVLHAMINKGL